VLAMTLNSPAAEPALEIRQRALLSAHAHNDYEHPHPLRDALAQGFNSVEADIWLVDGRLLVAHNLADVKSERTLQALYLDPLREHIRHNAGQVFTHATSFTLLIDLKSPAEPTYVALRELLLGYIDILTVHTGTETQTHALTIILTGNRPLEMMAAEPLRYTAIDGRLADLKPNLSPQLVPLISESWTQHFKWRGKGAFPAEEQIKLRQLVGRVHQQGRRLRFWAIPDAPGGWRELQAAGVDVIGTDDLVGLAKFLEATKR
jgi:glycerophosphoryl diester phosphodiesterase